MKCVLLCTFVAMILLHVSTAQARTAFQAISFISENGPLSLEYLAINGTQISTATQVIMRGGRYSETPASRSRPPFFASAETLSALQIVQSVQIRWFSFAEQAYYAAAVDINANIAQLDESSTGSSMPLLGIYVTFDNKLEIWSVLNTFDAGQCATILGIKQGSPYMDESSRHAANTELFRSKGRIPLTP